jgi:hypothetical protein
MRNAASLELAANQFFYRESFGGSRFSRSFNPIGWLPEKDYLAMEVIQDIKQQVQGNWSRTRSTRHPVLILCHADGYIEVYGDHQTDVRIQPVPRMTSNAGEILAERYVETVIPRRYRDIYYPGNLLTRDMPREITPAMIANRDMELSMFRMLDTIQHDAGRIAS